MAVGLLLAFVFKLNKALVLIAANISIPPMIPIVIYLSHLAGKLWMGDKATPLSFSQEITLDLIHNNFMQYVYGAITLAIIAGIVIGLLTYILIKIFKKKTYEVNG